MHRTFLCIFFFLIPFLLSGCGKNNPYAQIEDGDFSEVRYLSDWAKENLDNLIKIPHRFERMDLNKDGKEELFLFSRVDAVHPGNIRGYYLEYTLRAVFCLKDETIELQWCHFSDDYPFYFLFDDCLLQCKALSGAHIFTEYPLYYIYHDAETDGYFSLPENTQCLYYYAYEPKDDEDTSDLEGWGNVWYFHETIREEKREVLFSDLGCLDSDAWEKAFEEMTGIAFPDFFESYELSEKRNAENFGKEAVLSIEPTEPVPALEWEEYEAYFRGLYPDMTAYGCYDSRYVAYDSHYGRYMHSVSLPGGCEDVFFETEEGTWVFHGCVASEVTKNQLLHDNSGYPRFKMPPAELAYAFYVSDWRDGATEHYPAFRNAQAFLEENGFADKPVFLELELEDDYFLSYRYTCRLYLDEETKEGCGVVDDDHGFFFTLYEADEEYLKNVMQEITKGDDVESYENNDRIIEKTSAWTYTEDGKPLSYELDGLLPGWEDEHGDRPYFILKTDWFYNADGSLKRKETDISSRLNGTYMCSYDIFYDEKERPTHVNGYITHGSLEYCFFYEGEETTPHYILTLDYMGLPYATLHEVTAAAYP